jgi:hypothetical protein
VVWALTVEIAERVVKAVQTGLPVVGGIVEAQADLAFLARVETAAAAASAPI